MATSTNDMLVREIDDLAENAEKLSREASSAVQSLGPDRIELLSSIVVRTGQLIRRLYGRGSLFEENLEAIRSPKAFPIMNRVNYTHISQLAGLIKGIQHEVKAGLLSDVRQLLRAEIFADFIDMAEHLVHQKYKDAAAVMLGSILEDSLRKIAASADIKTTNEKGKPLTMSPLNDALAKAEIYSPLVQRQVATWATLRNAAAHGNYGEYDIEQTKQMLLFVQKFCAEHLR